MCALSETNVYVVGDYGAIYHSIDAGDNWEAQPNRGTDRIYGINTVGGGVLVLDLDTETVMVRRDLRQKLRQGQGKSLEGERFAGIPGRGRLVFPGPIA